MSRRDAVALDASSTAARPRKPLRAAKAGEPRALAGGEEELGPEALRLLDEAREEREAGARFFTSEEIKREFGL